MKYYKLIKDNTIIGVINSNNFIRYQIINKLFIGANEDTGEFVDYNGQLYRALWMKPLQYNPTIRYEIIEIVQISEEEYNILTPAIENYPIEIEEVQDEIIPANINQQEDITLDFVRTSKITEMSRACNQIIEAGFDIQLSDGETHHFSLTTQDQLNLISLSSMAASGMEAIPYHADGEICRFYTNAEMQAIVAQATAYKIYHTTYYNALKNYINSLQTIEEIAAVTYGIELPEEYQSEVLKSLQQ